MSFDRVKVKQEDTQRAAQLKLEGRRKMSEKIETITTAARSERRGR